MFPANLAFGILLLLGTVVSASSGTLIGVWVGLELNMLIFIPLLIKGSGSPWPSLTYLLWQSVGSAFLILSLAFNDEKWFMLGLIVKLGVAPFHFWLPKILVSVSWGLLLIVVTIQKVAPLVVMTSFYFTSDDIWILLLLAWISAVWGGLGGVGVSQVKELIAYSSIMNIGWLIFRISVSQFICIYYMVIYLLITFIIVMELHYLNLTNPRWNKINVSTQVGLLSLAGLPPLVGFLPKFRVILEASALHVFPLIVGAVFRLFYYITLIRSSFLWKVNWSSWFGVIFNAGLPFTFLFLYAMIILDKPQRYWNPIFTFWYMSGYSRNFP